MAKYLITKNVGAQPLSLELLVPRRILKTGMPYGLCWAECGFNIQDINAPDGKFAGNDSWDSEAGPSGEFDGDACQMVRMVDESKLNPSPAAIAKIIELFPNASWDVYDELDQFFIDTKADMAQALADSQA